MHRSQKDDLLRIWKYEGNSHDLEEWIRVQEKFDQFDKAARVFITGALIVAAITGTSLYHTNKLGAEKQKSFDSGVVVSLEKVMQRLENGDQVGPYKFVRTGRINTYKVYKIKEDMDSK